MAKLSTKNQITIPVDALREAGIEQGDDLRVHVVGRGRLEVVRQHEWLEEFAGSMPGLGPSSEVARLRREWDRR